MSKCSSHALKGEAPRFLKPLVCDDCAAIDTYRKRQSTQRKNAATRANRSTAQINGLPASAVVHKFHASQLPKTDPWYRPRKKGGVK